MELFLLHLIKSSALLSIFFTAYFFFLRKDKSFVNNRIYLLAGIISSLFLPFIKFTKRVVQEQGFLPAEFEPTGAKTFNSTAVQEIDLWQLAGILYFVISGFHLLKISFNIIQVLKLASAYSIKSHENLLLINTRARTTPFSFFNIVVYNASLHSEQDMEMIIEHEKVHVRQWHSVDMLFSNILTAVLWFNPITWYYRKCVEQNLEYLADRETIAVVGKKREYQYALLRVSVSGNFPSLLNHFHQSYVKNRIRMLGKDSSGRNRKWKPLVVLPLIALFMYSFNVREQTGFPGSEATELSKADQEPVFYIDNTTTDHYIRQMESYFSKHYPDLDLVITGVERNKEFSLTGFELRTRFRGEQEFQLRLENKGDNNLKPRFALQYSSAQDEPSLIVTEQGTEELEIQITQNELNFSHPIEPISHQGMQE